MIKPIHSVLAAIAVAAIAAGQPAQAGEPAMPIPEKCEIPTDLLPDAMSLPHAERSLKRQRRLTIVALGSSSTLGLGASDSLAAWPARLEAILAGRLQGVEVRVINRGVARESAQQMLDRIDTDVLAEKPSLVIWESGTAEAVRGADVEEYTDALLAGVDRMAGAGIDVILMDTQYARRMAQLINFQPYLAAIDQVAGMRGLARFPRYNIMHYWADDERFTFAEKSAVEARKTADQVYDCLGQLIAGWLVRGIASK